MSLHPAYADWANTKSSTWLLPEIRAGFFTGGRPTTHKPEGGLAWVDARYTNHCHRYLSGMDTEAGRDHVKFSLQQHFMHLACEKNMTLMDCVDHDYPACNPTLGLQNYL